MSTLEASTQPVATEALPDGAPYLERCFFFDAKEKSYEITGIEGKIPAWLRGSYYVNGPARFERGPVRYRHWLDGDGMVCALHFTAEGVEFHNRFVRTRKLCGEEQAGKAVYRTFGTAFSGDQLRLNVMLEAPVNVSVYPYAGTLLAFGEQTLPIELDPITLESRGQYDFHQRLNDISPFAAHAKFDPATGHLFNFGVHYSAQPSLQTYEFDAEGNLLSRRRHPLAHAHSIHDFCMSDRHIAFFLSPLFLDMKRFLGSGLPLIDALQWEPGAGSQILVIPRDGAAAFSVEANPGYCLHTIHCFEQNGRLAVDLIELEGPIYPEYQPIPDLFATVPPGQPVRYWIDLDSHRVVERIRMDYDRTPDFPSLDNRLLGKPYDSFWMLGISSSGKRGRKFFDQLARGSWRKGSVADLYQTPAGEYLGGEPIFVPNPNEPEDGVVIVQHLKPRCSAVDYLVFDAARLQSGPIARLPLKYPVHPGFHASFLPGA
ncbi:MAG TPA: carotenoid oxygenase family protein [Bryobacteraceae bacterium]|nr:carotenoid oxygenase family protein [Bryobacteraceae bacterium]